MKSSPKQSRSARLNRVTSACRALSASPGTRSAHSSSNSCTLVTTSPALIESRASSVRCRGPDTVLTIPPFTKPTGPKTVKSTLTSPQMRPDHDMRHRRDYLDKQDVPAGHVPESLRWASKGNSVSRASEESHGRLTPFDRAVFATY